MNMAKAKTTKQPEQPKQPEQQPPAPTGNLVVDLGIPEVVDLPNTGYIPSRPEITLGPRERKAIKRLAMTLDMSEATLKNGQLVKNSVQRTVAWLCERFADSLEADAA